MPWTGILDEYHILEGLSDWAPGFISLCFETNGTFPCFEVAITTSDQRLPLLSLLTSEVLQEHTVTMSNERTKEILTETCPPHEWKEDWTGVWKPQPSRTNDYRKCACPCLYTTSLFFYFDHVFSSPNFSPTSLPTQLYVAFSLLLSQKRHKSRNEKKQETTKKPQKQTCKRSIRQKKQRKQNKEYTKMLLSSFKVGRLPRAWMELRLECSWSKCSHPHSASCDNPLDKTDFPFCQ